MKILLIPVAVPLLFVATLSPQDPTPPARKAEAPTDLQSLQLLVTETVHARHPTAASPATPPGGTPNPIAHDQEFARVQDAAFDADGRLLHFVVTAPPNAKVADTAPRSLGANAVRWDGATRRWLLIEPTTQFAELAAHERTATPTPQQPAVAVKTPPRYASELLRAELADAGIGKPAEASSGIEARPPRIVWWFAAGPRQLAVAAVPRDGKHLLIPFAAIKLDGTETPKVRLEPAAALPSAPTIDNPETAPTAEARRHSHTYYGTTTPDWDRAEPGDARKPPRGEGEGKGKHKGEGAPDGQERGKG
jgi:hypothetical protein